MMNSKQPLISMIIPVYNVEEYLRQCLDSVAAQTYRNLQIILIDDGSTDNSGSICDGYAASDSRMTVIHTANKGLSAARNAGLDIAKGEYIAVMDADLQHPPEILRAMFAVVSSGYDVCIPSRFIKGGGDGGLNMWRKFVSWSARMMGKILLSSLRKVSDPTSGLFMFKRGVIDGADLQPIGWKIMIEVVAMGSFSTLCEIPYVFCERNAGESKLDSKVTMEYIQQLFGLLKREKKKKIAVSRFSQEETEQYLQKLDA